ncbi:unnamed protein product [Mytilus edulis]|uniref:Uncharacterized protein n=1 Tax=Mytilus edulis TaxID=6550 RepID=A0A8S3QC42_MYTED|nr:unnamed protein product [Mytilus edulis]
MSGYIELMAQVLAVPGDVRHGFSYVCQFNHDFGRITGIADSIKMAQVLAVPGHVRHGFSYICQFNHDFGRITGIAATMKGNILLCDYDKKNLILVDPLGNYLKKLYVDSEPYDIAITSQNIGYITKPKSRSVIQIDPDRMVELFQATCNNLSTTVLCVSAVPSVKEHGLSYAIGIRNDQINLTDLRKTGDTLGSCVVKFHKIDENSSLSCIGGQNYITYKEIYQQPKKIDNIATMDSPTDICSDDYGHFYVSGQGSNNIHRIESYIEEDSWGEVRTTKWRVLDIPLHTDHGIKEPVALCFNQDYSKLYVVNDWGKTVLIFDNLILVDPLGTYLKKLDIDSEPYDVAITSQNIGCITQPNSRSVLQIDPDRMMILFKATCNELSTTVFCVSAVPNTGRDLSGNVSCFLGVKIHGSSSLTDISTTSKVIGSCVVRFHILAEQSFLSCIGGQNYIAYNDRWGNHRKIIKNIATMDTPTDICSDNNGHTYVSGQGSNNIHRLEEFSKIINNPYSGAIKVPDWKVLDIPLDSRHGIMEPVAMCFNHDYSKLYIVNDWGKSVLIFDVI